MSARMPSLRLPWQPYPWQDEVLLDLQRVDSRIVVVAGGRRSGKSDLGNVASARTLIEKPDAVVFFASPVFAQARSRFRGFVKLMRLAAPGLLAAVNKSQLRVELVNGSAITFVSAFDADRLRGEGLDLLVLDEGGYVEMATWTDVLRPMLSDRLGKALVIGTPKGKGQLLHVLYSRGEAGEPGYVSHRYPTSANPSIAPEEIDAARSGMPADSFDQEYLARFIDGGAGVFRGISACIGGALEGPRPGRRYVLGCDLAQVKDFSVYLVLDARSRQVVHINRNQGVSYANQVTAILDLAWHYNSADVVVDETGLGRPVLDMLRASLGRTREETRVDRRGGRSTRTPRVTGMTLTSQSKQDLVQKLQLDIERARIRIPAECTALLSELELFGYEMLPSGRIAYSAPEGHHDDTVIALALAAFGIPREAYDPDSIDPDDRSLIRFLVPRVANSARYGFPKSRCGRVWGPPLFGNAGNWFAETPPPTEGEFYDEIRLLQVARRCELLTREEADVLAEDLRRRIRANPTHQFLGTSKELSEQWRFVDAFVADTQMGG